MGWKPRSLDTLPSRRWAELGFYELQNFPVYKLLQRPDCARFIHRPEDYRKSATVAHRAYYLVAGMSYHSWAYLYEGKRFWFCWESGYDDMHRALSGSGIVTWYDLYPQGAAMDIHLDPSHPERHCFDDPLLREGIQRYIHKDPAGLRP